MVIDELTNKQQRLFRKVKKLYQNPPRKLANWSWHNHVKIVTANVLQLGKKYKAKLDYVLAGALLHDIGDIWYERTDPEHEKKTLSTTKTYLKKVGFKSVDISKIFNEVINPHSCYPENMPTTIEGKILATADAMAHLNTNLYPTMKKMGLPKKIKPKDFNAWIGKKIDRDFYAKIFFDDERKKTRENYENLKKLFAK